MEDGDVQVYFHPNAEIRSYLTLQSITKPRVEAFAPPLDVDPDGLTAKLGTIGAQTVRELLGVPGVARIRIKPKEVRIQKTGHASWDDMEGDILRIMKRAVRKSRMHVAKR
ncbi:MAG: NifU N-terminal domain-containing protein [Deltaproteobacteria bacterium]|nr:NifU N-terminal domain-containing protein [Deltaproteobacteria bacterium]